MMQDTAMKTTEFEKAIKENPVAALVGLFALAAMLEKKGVVPMDGAPGAKEPNATMDDFRVIEATARDDLSALMDACFSGGGSVFFSDYPTGGCWSYDIDGQYRNKPHTVAIVGDVIGKKSTGVSALNPPDEFSIVIGRVIALRRAMGKTVPKEYYTAGALLAKAKSDPTGASPHLYQVGDMVKVVGKSSPVTASSSAHVGGLYKVEEVRLTSVRLNLPTAPWVSKADVIYVGASAALEPVKCDTPFAVGDTVKVIGKTEAPTTSAHVEVGEISKVQQVSKSGDSVQLVGGLCRWVSPKDLERVEEVLPTPRATPGVGDTVRVLRKTVHPSTSSMAHIDGLYHVEQVVGDRIRLDIPSCPWVNVTDIEVVSARIKIISGDYVRVLDSGSSGAKVGGIYKVVEVKPSGLLKIDIPTAPYIDPKRVEHVRMVHRRANVGETICINTTGAFGADVKKGDYFKITGHSEGGNEILGTNINTGENGGWYMNQDFYEVVEAVNALTPAVTTKESAEKWVRRPAQAGDTIRVLEDGPCLAKLKAGDILKVERRLPHDSVETVKRECDEQRWWIADFQYEVLDV